MFYWVKHTGAVCLYGQIDLPLIWKEQPVAGKESDVEVTFSLLLPEYFIWFCFVDVGFLFYSVLK